MAGLSVGGPDVVPASTTTLVVTVGALEVTLGGLGRGTSELGSTPALLAELETGIVEARVLASGDTLVGGVVIGVDVGLVREVSVHAVVAVHVTTVGVPSDAGPGGPSLEVPGLGVVSDGVGRDQACDGEDSSEDGGLHRECVCGTGNVTSKRQTGYMKCVKGFEESDRSFEVVAVF